MRRLTLMLILCAICGSCDKSDNRKATYPVTGVVRVDGQPVGQLAISCVSATGLDKANPTVSAAFTDKEGAFKISTYEKGDGVPVGDYVLTVIWGQMNLLSMQYGGPDKLKGKYADPATSTIKFTVKEGVPTDLGTNELTTK